ncbi:MAG: hypothetical protein AAGL10_01775 [Pseudomonadota bacterium]
MKTALFGAAALMLVPLSATFAFDDPASKEEKATTAEAKKESSEDQAAEAKAEDEVTCRYVRLDTSSRRKSKVCRTKEGWLELNNPR